MPTFTPDPTSDTTLWRRVSFEFKVLHNLTRMRLKLVLRVVKDFNQEIRPLIRDFLYVRMTPLTACVYLKVHSQSHLI